jgi:hypothetical protein
VNLHSIVSGHVAAVNPFLTLGLQVSVGSVLDSGYVPRPGFATPGRFSASLANGVLTVEDVPAAGVVQVGQTLADDTGVLEPGTVIIEQGTGRGGAGTYYVTGAQTVPTESMSTFVKIKGQVQPVSNALRRDQSLNLEGVTKSVYTNGLMSGVVRAALKGGDQLTLPDGSVWLVTAVPEEWNLTAGWTLAVITLQTDAIVGPGSQSDAQPAGVP